MSLLIIVPLPPIRSPFAEMQPIKILRLQSCSAWLKGPLIMSLKMTPPSSQGKGYKPSN